MYEVAGILGVFFYLGSYSALQFGYIKGRGYTYASLNLTASSLVLVSLIGSDWNSYSAAIQISWIVISVVGITRTYLLNRNIRIGPNEQRVIESIVPGLDKADARQVVRLGRWVEGTDRLVLTQEGLPISELIWVQSGTVAVYVSGQRVARVGEGAVLGEATCLTGAPATATVMVEGGARYFAIPVAPLRALADRNPIILAKLQESFSRHMREKLLESNKRAASRAHNA